MALTIGYLSHQFSPLTLGIAQFLIENDVVIQMLIGKVGDQGGRINEATNRGVIF